MNKKIIAVAVAAGLTLPIIAAQAADMETKSPEVYGKLHVNLSKYDNDGTAGDNFKLNSFDSRLGFKGQQNLAEGLVGTYQAEGKIVVDGTTSNFADRTTYVGLKGGFGEVRVGYHDSPLKLAQGKFDQFGDTDGDFKHAGSQDAEHRNKNSITYLGKFGDVGVNLQLMPGEGNGTAGGNGNGVADSTSVAVTYNTGSLYLAAAQDSYDKKSAAGPEASMTRFVATYKVNDMQFGVLAQNGVEAVSASTAKENWLGLSFNVKLGSNNKLKAQYITTKDNGATVEKGTQTTIGFDHKLGKKGTLYAMYNNLDMTTNAKDKSSVSVGYI
ncbi:MAG: porin, partial [Gammaproteobacteria bacterium]|nr:porin [Gammaproteobacteria bacterium]